MVERRSVKSLVDAELVNALAAAAERLLNRTLAAKGGLQPSENARHIAARYLALRAAKEMQRGPNAEPT
jgi:hypothetical protein